MKDTNKKQVAIITADFAVLDRTIPSFPNLLWFVDRSLDREIKVSDNLKIKAGLLSDFKNSFNLGVMPDSKYNYTNLDQVIETIDKRKEELDKSGIKFKSELSELLEIYKERVEYLKEKQFKPGGKQEATADDWRKSSEQVDKIQELTLKIKNKYLVCWEEVGGTGFNKAYATKNVLKYGGAEVDVRFLGMTGDGNTSQKIEKDFKEAGISMDYTMRVLTNSKTSIIYPFVPGVDSKGNPNHDRSIEKSPAQEQVPAFEQEQFNAAFGNLENKDMVILSVEAMSIEKLGKENFLKFVNECLKLKEQDEVKFKLTYAPPTSPDHALLKDEEVKEALQELHKKCDLLCCNENEAILCYADENLKQQYKNDKKNPDANPQDILNNLNAALDNAVGKLQNMKLEDGWNPHQMVVVTNGPRQMRVITTTKNKDKKISNKVKTFDPEKIESNEIVSTLGAGDAFAGALTGIIGAVKMGLTHKFGMDTEETQKLPKLVEFASRFAGNVIRQIPARIPQKFIQSVIENLVPKTGFLEKAAQGVSEYLTGGFLKR